MEYKEAMDVISKRYNPVPIKLKPKDLQFKQIEELLYDEFDCRFYHLDKILDYLENFDNDILNYISDCSKYVNEFISIMDEYNKVIEKRKEVEENDIKYCLKK